MSEILHRSLTRPIRVGNLIIGGSNEVIIQSGEAMSILWGAFKSCILPGDRVLCISTGFFGSGFVRASFKLSL